MVKRRGRRKTEKLVKRSEDGEIGRGIKVFTEGCLTDAHLFRLRGNTC